VEVSKAALKGAAVEAAGPTHGDLVVQEAKEALEVEVPVCGGVGKMTTQD